jgi:beta-lactamase class A
LQSTFNRGFLRGLPTATKTAHKFGEYIDTANGIVELHESGVIYIKNKPYVVTIMTRGKNLDELSVVIGKVSKLIYDEVAQDTPSL